MKPGGQMVPRTATYQIPAAWQCVGCDVGEVMTNNFTQKANFVLYIDPATKLVITDLVFIYPRAESRQETGQQLMESFAISVLKDRPRPQ